MFSEAASPKLGAAEGTSEGPASVEEFAMAAAGYTADAEYTGWRRRALAALALFQIQITV